MHHRPPQRTPFTTTALRSGLHPPTEYARMAREAFSLLGHPDADVQLEPTLPDGDSVRCPVVCAPSAAVFSFLFFFLILVAILSCRAPPNRPVF